MSKKTKFLIIAIILLLSAPISLLLTVKYSNNSKLKELSSLNSKYGLISVEAIDENTTAPQLTSLFKSDTLKTDVINILEPKQEVIVKLESEKYTKDLENIFFLKLQTSEEIDELIEEYEELEIVKYAEPNYLVELDEWTNINIFEGIEEESQEEPPQEPQAEETQIEEQIDRDIIIAVVDSGVDQSHRDLRKNLLKGWDFIREKEDVVDEEGHGTHVAGIIINNFSSAKVIPVRFTDGKVGKIRDLVKAIKFAADNEADVINLSLGLTEDSKLLKEAVNYADEKGAIIVAAAGNNKSSDKYYPAAWENVIAVSALKKNGDKLYLSNYGEWVDFSTSAQDVYSTAPDNSYSYRTGTSQAAPVVSAKIAEILFYQSKEEKLPRFDIYESLNQISVPIEGKYKGLLGVRIPNQYEE